MEKSESIKEIAEALLAFQSKVETATPRITIPKIINIESLSSILLTYKRFSLFQMPTVEERHGLLVARCEDGVGVMTV